MKDLIRHPRNCPGDFYSLSEKHFALDGSFEYRSTCLSCEAPQACAPHLLCDFASTNGDTYFVRQPQNAKEVSDACNAMLSCCLGALRYAGTDVQVFALLKIDHSLCDNLPDTAEDNEPGADLVD